MSPKCNCSLTCVLGCCVLFHALLYAKSIVFQYVFQKLQSWNEMRIAQINVWLKSWVVGTISSRVEADQAAHTSCAASYPFYAFSEPSRLTEDTQESTFPPPFPSPPPAVWYISHDVNHTSVRMYEVYKKRTNSCVRKHQACIWTHI